MVIMNETVTISLEKYDELLIKSIEADKQADEQREYLNKVEKKLEKALEYVAEIAFLSFSGANDPSALERPWDYFLSGAFDLLGEEYAKEFIRKKQREKRATQE